MPADHDVRPFDCTGELLRVPYAADRAIDRSTRGKFGGGREFLKDRCGDTRNARRYLERSFDAGR
jgi:hypothetical protein